MQTALDADPSGFNDYERGLIEAVREHGWFCPSVYSDEDGPGFSYSVGFWKTLGKPEVIVFGLPPQVAHSVLWQLYRLFQSGLSPQPGKPVEGVLEGYVSYLMPAGAKANEFMLSAAWFYGNQDYPRLQLVWPDPIGAFPWQTDFDPSFAEAQPDLSDRTWAAALRRS